MVHESVDESVISFNDLRKDPHDPCISSYYFHTFAVTIKMKQHVCTFCFSSVHGPDPLRDTMSSPQKTRRNDDWKTYNCMSEAACFSMFSFA